MDWLTDFLLYTGAIFIMLFTSGTCFVFKHTCHIESQCWRFSGFPFLSINLKIAVYYSSVSLVQNSEYTKWRARASVCRCLLGNRTAVPSGYIIKTSLLTPDVFHQIAKEKRISNNETVLFFRYAKGFFLHSMNTSTSCHAPPVFKPSTIFNTSSRFSLISFLCKKYLIVFSSLGKKLQSSNKRNNSKILKGLETLFAK